MRLIMLLDDLPRGFLDNVVEWDMKDWRGDDLANGLYFIEIEAVQGDIVARKTAKLVILR